MKKRGNIEGEKGREKKVVCKVNNHKKYLNLNGITRQAMANFASVTLEVRGKYRSEIGGG